MKIICNREQLLHAFQTAASVAPVRSPKPILQNVKLDVRGSEAVLLATDLEVGIRVQVQGIQIDAPGAVLLPVARFGSILRESSDDTLRIEADANGTTIRGQRSTFKLPGENPDEFPEVPHFNETKYHEVPARLLKELIKRTIFATDVESSRYALGGVLLELTEDRIIGVATDGRRLAKMEGPAKSVGGHVGEGMTIVPTKAMQLIDRALTDADAEVQLAARGNDVLLKAPRFTIYSRLVEGRFPRWRDAVPQRPNATKIPLTVGPALSAVRQAAIVAVEDSRGIEFNFSDGALKLSANAAEVGQSNVELPIPYDGQQVAIKLDHRFVSDFFKVLDTEKTVTLEIEDSDGPAYLESEDGYGYVVMPLSRD